MKWPQFPGNLNHIPSECLQDFRREYVFANYFRTRVIAWFTLIYPITVALILMRTHTFIGFNSLQVFGVIGGLFILSLVIVANPKVPRSPQEIQPWHRHLLTVYSVGWLSVIDITFLLIWSNTGVNTPYTVGIFIYTLLFYYPNRINFCFYLLNFGFYLICIHAFEFPFPNNLLAYISGTTATILAWLVASLLFNARVREFISKRKIELQAESLQRSIYRLNQLVSLDGLTQVANRRYFDQHLDQQWHQLQRSGEFLTLLLCDVDNFKLFNDTYGHQGGDACLCQIAKTIQSAVHRAGDLAARYGGEEFVVVLPHTHGQGAWQIAEEIRQQVQRLQIPHTGTSAGHVTISVGMAWCVPSPALSLEQLIATADQALYKAKYQGRNQVVWAGDLEDKALA